MYSLIHLKIKIFNYKQSFNDGKTTCIQNYIILVPITSC